MRRSFRAAAAVGCLLLVSSTARAQGGASLVAVVSAEPEAPTTRRIRGELESLGLDVIVLKPPAEGSPSREPLEEAARSVGAVAAIRVVPAGRGVEVWVADRATGKAVARHLDFGSSDGATSNAEVALGAVELLRASLMELHAVDPPKGDVAVSPKIKSLALPVAPTPAAERPTRLGAFVGGGASLGLRGLGTQVDGAIAGWTPIGAHVGLRVGVALPVAPARSRHAEGAVEVAATTVDGLVTLEPTDRAARFVPAFGVGLFGAHVRVAGFARAPFTSASDAAWRGGPLASLGLAITIAPGLRARVDVRGGLALGDASVSVADATVGHWGAPLVGATAGLEVLWGR